MSSQRPIWIATDVQSTSSLDKRSVLAVLLIWWRRSHPLLSSLVMHGLLLALAAFWKFTLTSATLDQPLLEARLTPSTLPPDPVVVTDFQTVQPQPAAPAKMPVVAGGSRSGRPQLFEATVSAPAQTPKTDSLDWEQALASPWTDSDLIAKFDPVGLAVSKLVRQGAGNGTGRGIGDGAGDKQFFGMTAAGKRFVYVIDGSKSMNRPHDSEAQTRFKRVKLELVKSIGSLPEDAQFFILFFNDYAVSMPAPGLESATAAAKQKYLLWMQQVITTGNTEPTAAISLAFKLKPDVIYFLSDGDFNSRVRKELIELPQSTTTVQTFAFEETLTEPMQRAFDLLEADKPLAAQKAVHGKDYHRTLMAWRGQKFLREFAERYRGTLVLIP